MKSRKHITFKYPHILNISKRGVKIVSKIFETKRILKIATRADPNQLEKITILKRGKENTTHTHIRGAGL